MSLSNNTPQDNQNALSAALEQVAVIDREVDALENQIKELKKRREALAEVAVEEMTAGRLDGVRVAGRSWRVEWEHSVSATAANVDDVIAAAKAVGKGDALISVNTSRLKSLLKELSKDAGRDAREPWADGTPFSGLVSEYVRPVLRHLTVG
jgi:phage shock protein A